MALDIERRKEIGARLKELRGPVPQPVVADRVGVTLRAYQAWEAGDSGIAYDNVVKLAKAFKVTEDYILNGPPPETVDESQLDRIERRQEDLDRKLDEVLSLLRSTRFSQLFDRPSG